MQFSDFWKYIQIRKWGKYVLVLLAFGVVYLFIGDQSIINFIRRGNEIRSLELQRDEYNAASEQAQRELQLLNNPDSLEKFAREHYYMHTPEEDIYLVEE